MINDLVTNDFETNIKLKDIIEVDVMQKIQDDFSKAFGMGCITLDADNNSLTEQKNCTDFCMKYTRNSKIGNKRCLKCDYEAEKKIAETGQAQVYRCHLGLIEFVVPIIIEGKKIGCICGGQINTHKMDEEKVRQLAEEFGINPEDYVDASKKIRIIEEDTINAVASIMYTITNILAQEGYKQYIIKKMFDLLKENIEQISSTMEEFAASSSEINEYQNKLNEKVENVKEFSYKINDISDFIKKIANETNMLGLNAAIESGRAGSFGAGFGVVASEIRKLSTRVKETVNDIVEINTEIQSSLDSTTEISKDTLLLTNQQASATQEISANLEEIMELAEKLNKLQQSKL